MCSLCPDYCVFSFFSEVKKERCTGEEGLNWKYHFKDLDVVRNLRYSEKAGVKYALRG